MPVAEQQISPVVRPTLQVVPTAQPAPQAVQSLSLRATQLAPQHSSPRVPPIGRGTAGSQLVPAPQRQVEPSQRSDSGPQATPHPPQWSGSLVVSTHAPPQQVEPAGQVSPEPQRHTGVELPGGAAQVSPSRHSSSPPQLGAQATVPSAEMPVQA